VTLYNIMLLTFSLFYMLNIPGLGAEINPVMALTIFYPAIDEMRFEPLIFELSLLTTFTDFRSNCFQNSN
jgi:hypothetical protein